MSLTPYNTVASTKIPAHGLWKKYKYLTHIEGTEQAQGSLMCST